MKNLNLIIATIALSISIYSIGYSQTNLEEGRKMIIKKGEKGSKIEGIELRIKSNMMVVENSSNPIFKKGDIYAKNIKLFKTGNGFVLYEVDLKNVKGDFEKKLFYFEDAQPNQILGINMDCATVVFRDGTRVKDCAYGSDPTIIVYL
jgi:hypothetical protein